jgi:hypothetical protein
VNGDIRDDYAVGILAKAAARSGVQRGDFLKGLGYGVGRHAHAPGQLRYAAAKE